MKKKELSWAEIKESIAELRDSQKETSQQIKETGLHVKKTMKGLDRIEKLYEDLGIKVKDVDSRVAGISDSNGRFAEEYFYSSLEKKMEFAGVHFDSISNKFGYMKKLPNGERLEDQFDIVMINDNAVALIEVKYSADSDYPKKMIEKKIPNFKTLFPDYADYKVYLGIGSLSFDDYVVGKAKEYGIGLLKQVGETIEYETKWVRAY
jgi:hypothetical protein